MTQNIRTALFSIPFLALSFLAACTDGDGAADGSPEGPGAFATLELEVAYPVAFSFLNGVRELEEGTVMAADPLSQVLLRVDLLAATADTLGRVGEGPQEYQQPDQVFPLPGDSTLLVDLGKAQLMVVDPQGSFHTGTPMVELGEDASFLMIQPRFVDSDGRLYFLGGADSREAPADSLQVSRFDRHSGVAETLGWLWRTPPIETRIDGGVRRTSVRMAPRDDWAAGADGGWAIVRADGYRVEWHFPDGRVVNGPSNPVDTPTLTDDDKYASFEAASTAGMRVSVFSGDNGATEVAMSRVGGSPRPREEINLRDYEWADRYPPFRPERARVSPAGELWVERWLHPDVPPLMDVFGEDGVKMGSVELPTGREIIGWGTTAGGAPAVYLVRTDEFGLMYLERYQVVR
jgi:hypothetical protein